MQKMIILAVVSLLFLLHACKSNGNDIPDPIPRDTTITPESAFTKLQLDSNSVEQFISGRVKNEAIEAYIRNFYNSRNYQFAWFNESGLSEQGEAFWNLHQQDRVPEDSSTFSEDLHVKMDYLLNQDTSFLNRSSLVNLELGLTQHFFMYMKGLENNEIDPGELQWHIPRRKLEPMALLDTFLQGKHKDWKVYSKSYYRMQDKLSSYAAIARNGGWGKIDMSRGKIRPGKTDDFIPAIKKRLLVSGDYAGEDSTTVYTPELEAAVKQVQFRMGLKQDGIIDKDFIEMLNVPVEDRIRQMLVNMERLKWMPEEPAHRIVANIPDYRLQVWRGDSVTLSMDIVVGKAANRTVVFSDELQYVVFAPYWNIPRSIVRNEIVPAMNRNSNYLRRNNMEITGYSNGLPVVRQLPGRGNALGKVKFIFPNRYNIYFHDTPAKSLFSREKRAFSHGCIRLSQPFDMANYLLQDDSRWDENAITTAMNSGTEKWVKLDEPVKVFIVYFTAWVDVNGVLHFRDDIYGHDKRLAEQLFPNGGIGNEIAISN